VGEPTLHVVFGSSPSGIVRQAVTKLGRNDFVITFHDDLSLGPINYDRPEVRAAWLNRELGMFDWLEFVEDDEDLCLRCHGYPGRLVAWYNPGNVGSYAGFQWWIAQIGRTPCAVLCDPRLNDHNVDAMADLFGQEVELSDEARARHHAEWLELEQDNAVLRILYENRLWSVPLEYFDEAILGLVPPEWQSVLRVLYATFVNYGFGLNEEFVRSRLRVLHRAGAIEWRGGRTFPPYGDVRLAAH
jgi:hypothetical protein